MQSWGRRAAVAVLAALVVTAGCSADDDPARRIGIVRAVEGSPSEVALAEGLLEGGYGPDEVEVLGGDLGEAQADPEAMRDAAAEQVADGAEVLLALSTSVGLALVEADLDVPLLVLAVDPVASGLVDDPRSPGGNVTGASYRVPSDRVLGLGMEAFDGLKSVGCLFAEGDPATGPAREDLRRGAAALDLVLQCRSWRDDAGVTGAITDLVAGGVDALVVLNSPATVRSFPALERALRSVSVPVLTTMPAPFATLSLRPDGEALYRQLGRQAARLLDGAPVSAIPVEDPAAFELVVNLDLARRIGARLPAALVARADEVVGGD